MEIRISRNICSLLVGMLAFTFSASSHAVTPYYTATQTNVFSDLRVSYEVLPFDLIYSKLQKDIDNGLVAGSFFNSPIEPGQIRNISFRGRITETSGTWSLTNSQRESKSVQIQQWIKGWLSSSIAVGSAVIPVNWSLSGGSTFDFSNPLGTSYNDSVNVAARTGSGSGSLPGSASGDFGTQYFVDIFGTIDRSLFPVFFGTLPGGSSSGDQFEINMFADSSTIFSNTAGLVVNNDPPSFNGSLVLTYEIIPEPSAGALLMLGIGGLIALRRMRRS